MELPPYQPVDVEAAATIATKYRKAIVAIVAWDSAHGKTNVTTFGATPNDKIGAAKLGEIITAAVLPQAEHVAMTTYEDFRLRRKAEWEAERRTLKDIVRLQTELLSCYAKEIEADPLWAHVKDLVSKLEASPLNGGT